MSPMSRAELAEIVDNAPPADLIFLQAYLEHRARASNPENGSDLDRRLEIMRAGREVSLEDALQLHQELAARSL